jgi:hypothetical protein
MKTELVANWVLVDGHLTLQWFLKDDNRVVIMSRFMSQPPKTA